MLSQFGVARYEYKKIIESFLIMTQLKNGRETYIDIMHSNFKFDHIIEYLSD
jgi:hypothetical protein